MGSPLCENIHFFNSSPSVISKNPLKLHLPVCPSSLVDYCAADNPAPQTTTSHEGVITTTFIICLMVVYLSIVMATTVYTEPAKWVYYKHKHPVC